MRNLQLIFICVLLLVAFFLPSPIQIYNHEERSTVTNTPNFNHPTNNNPNFNHPTNHIKCSIKKLSKNISMEITVDNDSDSTSAVKSVIRIHNPHNRKITFTTSRNISYQFSDDNQHNITTGEEKVILNFTRYSPEIARGSENWTIGRRPMLDVRWIHPLSGKTCSASFRNSNVLINNSDEYVFTKSFIFVNENEIDEYVFSSNRTSYSVFYPNGSERFINDMSIERVEKKIIHDDLYLPNNCDRNTINIFFIPTDKGITGLALRKSNSSSIWIDKDQTRDLSVISHELFHARACMKPSDEMAWITEGAAKYYGVLYTYKSNWAEVLKYPKAVRHDHSEFSLTSKNEWEDTDVNYYKGARVVAYLDYQIRIHTENKTFMYVVKKMNSKNTRVSYEEFRKMVVNVTDDEIGEWMDKHIKNEEDISNRKLEKIKGAIKYWEEQNTLDLYQISELRHG